MNAKSEALLADVKQELASRIRQMAVMLAARGITIEVISGKRSTERQRQLYANRANNPYPVAVPGTSRHERAEAVDLSITSSRRDASTWQVVGSIGKSLGLRWGGDFKRADPVHFEFTGAPVTQPASSQRAQLSFPTHKTDYVLDRPNLMLYGVIALVAVAFARALSR